MSEHTQPLIRPAHANDHAEWSRLFVAYRTFYHLDPDDAVVERVWAWVADPDHETDGVVAELDGAVVGIAHFRAFARPSTGTIGLWLDDLYTDPSCRGHGIGRALISYLQDAANKRGYSIVRGITAADNYQAQELYNAVGSRTHWITYEAKPRTAQSR